MSEPKTGDKVKYLKRNKRILWKNCQIDSEICSYIQ